jgi:hypothetical protein
MPEVRTIGRVVQEDPAVRVIRPLWPNFAQRSAILGKCPAPARTERIIGQGMQIQCLSGTVEPRHFGPKWAWAISERASGLANL